MISQVTSITIISINLVFLFQKSTFSIQARVCDYDQNFKDFLVAAHNKWADNVTTFGLLNSY